METGCRLRTRSQEPGDPLLPAVRTRAMVVPMESIQVVGNDQARYALFRALIDIRISELVAALERHERDRANWRRSDLLAAIEEELGKAVETLGHRHNSSTVEPTPGTQVV